jgi:hypothetical protein
MDDSARPTMTGCGITRSETDDNFSKFEKNFTKSISPSSRFDKNLRYQLYTTY